MEISTGIFSGAILSLRRRLGETQEGMARRLGCNLRAYQRWERGTNAPRAQWLVKIRLLCPDEETRGLFDAAPAASSSELERRPPVKMSGKMARLIRVRNAAIELIKVLAESAAEGSPKAMADLKHITGQLVRVAGSLQRKRDAQK